MCVLVCYSIYVILKDYYRRGILSQIATQNSITNRVQKIKCNVFFENKQT